MVSITDKQLFETGIYIKYTKKELHILVCRKQISGYKLLKLSSFIYKVLLTMLIGYF